MLFHGKTWADEEAEHRNTPGDFEAQAGQDDHAAFRRASVSSDRDMMVRRMLLEQMQVVAPGVIPPA